jgi:hypothetical protein
MPPKIPSRNFAGRISLTKVNAPKIFPQNCGKDFSCAKNYIPFNNFFPKVPSRNPLSTNTPTTFDGHWYSIPLHFTHTLFAMTL